MSVSDVFLVIQPYGTFIAVLLTYAASSLLHVSLTSLYIVEMGGVCAEYYEKERYIAMPWRLHLIQTKTALCLEVLARHSACIESNSLLYTYFIHKNIKF